MHAGASIHTGRVRSDSSRLPVLPSQSGLVTTVRCAAASASRACNNRWPWMPWTTPAHRRA
jgi:hypothetical protein